MKYYKLLNSDGYEGWNTGDVFPEDFPYGIHDNPMSLLVTAFPDDWVEVKLLGYKVKPEYVKFAIILFKSKSTEDQFLSDKFNFAEECNLYFIAKEAGVLDLWCNPIFEEVNEFKVGDWVYAKKIGMYDFRDKEFIPIFKVAEIKDDFLRPIVERNTGIHKKYCRKATKQEIEKVKKDLLVKEAQKRYPVGTKFKSAYHDKLIGVVKIPLFYWKEDNLVVNDPQGYSVYANGKWAEIITTPQITINGYKAEFFDSYVKFGCAEINKEVFINLVESIMQFPNTNREIESITIGKGFFTKEIIKEIAEHYLNKK